MSDEKTTRYYGKFRGTVVNNVDPEQRGRIQAIVPDVQGLTPTTWAMPCVPIADPEYPIWVGGFWGAFAEVPPAALAPPPIPPGQTIVIQSTLQNAIIISDATPVPMQAPVPAPAPPGTGGIVLRSPTGAMIVVNDTGIYINNGKGASIDMMGPSVMINKGALVVT
jgi:hypothetical protein